MNPIDRVPKEGMYDASCLVKNGEWSLDDPRWPTHCACGYAFTASDEWQVFTETLYRRIDTGEETTLRDAPAGAMWYAPWFEDFWQGPDGRCLIVKTPGGDWVVDGPASNAPGKLPGWDRTGEPPNVTVTPSIGQGHPFRYHGWLRNGELVEC